MTRLRSAATRTVDSHVRTNPDAGRLALPLLLCGAVMIAFAPIFVRLSEIGPTATAFNRVFLALPALWLWNGLERRGAASPRPLTRLDFLGLVGSGLFFAGDLAFWHWSIRYTTVANATLLANFAPVFVVLASWILFGERFSRRFLVGMVTALAGACVLMGRSVTLSATNVLGDALGIVTAMFYAGYITCVGRLRARLSTATIMAWSGLITSAVLLPVAIASGESLGALSLYGWLVLLGLALISHCGGQGLIAHALAHLPAAFSSVSLLLQPAIAACLAWAILGEALGPYQGVGAILILCGIYLSRRGGGRIPGQGVGVGGSSSGISIFRLARFGRKSTST